MDSKIIFYRARGIELNFDILVDISNSLSGEYPENVAWTNSPFNWIRCLPPGSKGAIGRYLVSGLLQNHSYYVGVLGDGLRVNGNVIRVKTSLMWEADIIKFQNIRDTPFDFVLCLGICPDKAFGWLVPKDEIWSNGVVREERLGVRGQHKGADAWISINPTNVQEWLEPFGGTIDELVDVAKKTL